MAKQEFGWTKVYYDPDLGEIIHQHISDTQVYVGLDRGAHDHSAEVVAHVRPDGGMEVTAVKTWRHQIDLVANKDASE